ncbi:hypothetical protein T265_05151 [Opisthorchis viverrini]|uniref:Uncharacterized protein n=1 Tax=Opisthorchis viverrini TaxID=6198 RepID=A0A074ZQ51_OPIVI|nr:hypothetical protein T265_05151 [Opisthorchis viverrini]KER27952.1 hypothetical protein T265_05151 [Opisthorchis viverrini]
MYWEDASSRVTIISTIREAHNSIQQNLPGNEGNKLESINEDGFNHVIVQTLPYEPHGENIIPRSRWVTNRSWRKKLMAEAVEIAKHPGVNRPEGVELASVWRTVLDQSS